MSRGRQRVGRQLVELGWNAPQVIAHRTARASLQPSAKDQREFQRMVAEKPIAFFEAWVALTQAMWRTGFSLWTTWALAGWRTGTLAALQRQAQEDSWSAVAKGLAPIHQAVGANVRRLNRRGSR